ncbi:MAG TPA: ATP-binding protein [Micromonosporaceae bacterium]|nr:ATP-binding protein [Micromonosporaceae bacterium]
MRKPAAIVGRDRQWRSLERFLFEGGTTGPLRLGLVSGRRRTGKTQLLAAACEAVGGLYHACVQDEGDRAARLRFARAIAAHAGLASFADGEPAPWEDLLRAALATAARTAGSSGPALVVIDEFPYPLTHAPHLPSLIQHLYDVSQHGQAPGGRLVLCGSALSVMHELPSGTKPLRGRAAMDMRLPPLDYREAALLWGVADPQVALRLHACVGGIPGYKPLTTTSPEALDEFDRWVVGHLLAVDVGGFTRTEVDYLLREDPRITSRAIYYDVLSAVAAGATSPAKIGAAIGRDGNAVRYPLGVLESAGYLVRSSDLLRSRRPTITVADPVIRFDRLITAPHMAQLELGRAEQVWRSVLPTFHPNILGPHFETLARDWALRFAPDELGEPAGLGDIGYAQIQDRTRRPRHEVDVIGVRGKAVTLLGEAKATLAARTLRDLERLDHLRELLRDQGYDMARTKLALFSVNGFTSDLERAAAARRDVELVDLDRLYGTKQP